MNPTTSTVTLISAPNPSTFGAIVTFTATVTTGATGTVTFHEGGTTLGTGPISTGTVTFTTSSLAGGTHSITAQYGGDTNYSGSVSTAVSQVVNPTTSTVTLISSPNPSNFGASVTLTATVTTGATGSVTFHEGATSLGTGTISSGVATLTISSLAGGTHSITAQYGGDTNYSGSVSTPVSQVVNLLSSTVTLTSAPNPSTFGAGVTLTATVTSGATGSVTFHEGATNLGAGTISSGIAALSISSLAGGTHSITAQYGGDTNYNGSASTPISQVVNPASSTVTLVSSPNPSTFGASVTLTATVTAGATGSVTFHEGAATLGMGTISSGTATFTISSLPGGTHSITAQYGGDTNFNGSASTPISQVVNLASSTVALTSSPNPSAFGATVNLTATVTFGATGSVTFHEGATTLGTGTINSGIATLSISSLAGGTHSITAQYGGDTNYNGSVSTPISHVVTMATSTVTLVSLPNPSTFGASVTLTATVTSGATGTVTFHEGAATLGTGTISSGIATLSISSLAGGTHLITAQYAGDSNYNGSVSTPVSQVVTMAAVTTTLAVSPSTSPLPAKTVVTLTASVLSGATPVHPGLVTFCDATAAAQCKGLAVVGTAQLTPAGTAVLKFVPGSGSHNLLAVFAGTTSYATSSSSAQALTVSQPLPPYSTATAITSSGSAGNYTLTATLTATGVTTPTLTGSVSFLDTTNGNSVLGSSPLGPLSLTSNFTNASGSPIAVGATPFSVATADFNGDGLADLAATSVGNNNVSVQLGNGSGGFTPAPGSPVAAGDGPVSIATGDFNGDGIADLAVGSLISQTVTILVGDGNGRFAPAPGLPIAMGAVPQVIAVGDFNGDGIADLVVGTSLDDHSVNILLGDGSGGFAPAPGSPIATGSASQGIAIGDFNGDGIADLAVTNAITSSVSILLGDGSGRFAPSPGSPVAVGPNPYGVATGDFNGDGIADLAVVSQLSSNVSVLLGDGSGRFAPAPGSPIATGTAPFGVVVGNFNGDSIADLAVTNTTTNNVSILLGDGSGRFVPAPGSPVATGTSPLGVAIADFNGDGLVDLTTANRNSSNVSVLLNQVTQTATAQLISVNIVGTGTHDVNASYPGDTNFSGSTSTTIPLSATQATTALALTANPSSSTYGQQVVLTATLSSIPPFPVGSLTPTGTVTFLSNGVQIGTGTVTSGVATLNTTSLPAGTDSLMASYAGDPNFVSSTSPAVPFVVSKATPVITWANPAAITYGTALSATQLNATASVPGTFAYSPAVGVVLNAGTQTLNVTFTPTDTTNYTTATANVSIVVNKAMITLTANDASRPSGIANPAFTSTFTGFVNGDTQAWAVTGAPSLTTAAAATSPAGTYPIAAAVGTLAAANYTFTFVNGTLTVNKAPLTVTANDASRAYGVANPAFTSTITGFANGDTQASAVTGAPSLTTTATTASPAGPYPITAALGTLAAANYTFTFVNGTLTVTKGTPGSGGVAAVTVASSLNPSTYGTSVTFTATVPVGATGTATFEDNGTAISGAVPISGTTAAFATSMLVAGSHAITAVYSGDSNYNGANSLVLTQTVNMATTGPSTTLSVNPATVVYGDPAVLTAVVGPPAGATGTVSFHEGSTLLGTSSLDGSTTAVLSVSILNAGTHTITATYNGDVNFPASTSNPVTVTVTQRTGPGGGASSTVSVNDATRTTTEANPPFSHTVAGELVNGDTYATAVTGTPTYSTTAGTAAGTFEITVTGLTSANYALAFVPGTLTVVPTSSLTTLAASPTRHSTAIR